MRRSDKEIAKKTKIEAILEEAKCGRIALSHENMPYIVPMLFVYKNNIIYLHSANEGKKIEMIKHNNKVCFEVDEMLGIKRGKMACTFGVKYRSAIVFGTASLVTEPSERKRGLDLLMKKYSDYTEWDYDPIQLEKIQVIKIEIVEMTGKKSR